MTILAPTAGQLNARPQALAWTSGTIGSMSLGVAEYGYSVLSQSYSGAVAGLTSQFTNILYNLPTASVGGTVTVDVSLLMTASGGAFGMNFVLGMVPGALHLAALDDAAAAGGTNTLQQTLFNPVSTPVVYSVEDTADALMLSMSSFGTALGAPLDVPEPTNIGIFGVALAALAGLRRRTMAWGKEPLLVP